MEFNKKWGILSIFILGAAIMLYPVASNVLAIFTQSRVISNYESTVSTMSEEQINQEIQQAVSYNDQLAGESDAVVEGISYLDLLNIGEVMGYIEIPDIDSYLPIYHGTADAVLEKGIGHIEKTSLPVGGQSTHAVLTGHTGLPKAKLFTDLTAVEVGDIFYIHSLNEILAYEVDQIKIVLPEETSDLAIVPNEDYVTLVTCTPYGINTHRLLVRGTRINYVAPEIEENKTDTPIISVSHSQDETELPIPQNNKPVLYGSIMIIGSAIIIFIWKRRGVAK